VPRLVEALVGKKAIGASTGYAQHTAAWTEEGELFTFGKGEHGQLGHGGTQNELVPRLVQALLRKKVVGTAAGGRHIAVWTEDGDIFTFGAARLGQLGQRLGQRLGQARALGASLSLRPTESCFPHVWMQ